MSEESGRLSRPVSELDHVIGPATAPVTIVEYGDYQCPFCKAAVPIVEQLVEALRDNLRLIFRHFPLTRFHPAAEEAAEAAEAAAAQGQFWAMHKTLFDHQDALDDASLLSYAGSLRLDTARFESAMTEHTYRDHVQADLLSAMESGARGTPTFFIDGLRHDGPVDLNEMLGLIWQKHPELKDTSKAAGPNLRVPGMTAHGQEPPA